MTKIRRWLAFSARDYVWLVMALLAGLGGYVNSFFVCPEYPDTIIRYHQVQSANEQIQTMNEIHDKRVDDRIKELQKEMDKRQHEVEVELASIPRLKREIRRLEQLEARVKAGKKSH
jgi:hypothetical protein